jgi:hypothetical protein
MELFLKPISLDCLSICGGSDDALSSSGYKRRVVEWLLNNELEVIWTGVVVSYLNVPSWNARGRTEENYGKPHLYAVWIMIR